MSIFLSLARSFASCFLLFLFVDISFEMTGKKKKQQPKQITIEWNSTVIYNSMCIENAESIKIIETLAFVHPVLESISEMNRFWLNKCFYFLFLLFDPNKKQWSHNRISKEQHQFFSSTTTIQLFFKRTSSISTTLKSQNEKYWFFFISD